jgi:hypothetical protein
MSQVALQVCQLGNQWVVVANYPEGGSKIVGNAHPTRQGAIESAQKLVNLDQALNPS